MIWFYYWAAVAENLLHASITVLFVAPCLVGVTLMIDSEEKYAANAPGRARLRKYMIRMFVAASITSIALPPIQRMIDARHDLETLTQEKLPAQKKNYTW